MSRTIVHYYGPMKQSYRCFLHSLNVAVSGWYTWGSEIRHWMSTERMTMYTVGRLSLLFSLFCVLASRFEHLSKVRTWWQPSNLSSFLPYKWLMVSKSSNCTLGSCFSTPYFWGHFGSALWQLLFEIHHGHFFLTFSLNSINFISFQIEYGLQLEQDWEVISKYFLPKLPLKTLRKLLFKTMEWNIARVIQAG